MYEINEKKTLKTKAKKNTQIKIHISEQTRTHQKNKRTHKKHEKRTEEIPLQKINKSARNLHPTNFPRKPATS